MSMTIPDAAKAVAMLLKHHVEGENEGSTSIADYDVTLDDFRTMVVIELNKIVDLSSN